MTRDEAMYSDRLAEPLRQMNQKFHAFDEPWLRQRFRRCQGFDLPPITCSIDNAGLGRLHAVQATLRQHRDAHAAALRDIEAELGRTPEGFGLANPGGHAWHLQSAWAYRVVVLSQFDRLEAVLEPGKFDQTLEALTASVN